MTAPVHHDADALRDSLTCPQCEYSLRGLPGTAIHCPECGIECDIGRMMTVQWQRPWYEVPGFNRLLRPVACLTIGSLVLLYLGVLETQQLSGDGWMTLIGGAVLLLGWMVFMNATRGQFEDGRGPFLALLAHGLFFGYVAGAFGIIAALFGSVLQGHPAFIVAGLLMTALMVGLMMYCRRGERFIAQQCMNEYLRRDENATKSSAAVVSS